MKKKKEKLYAGKRITPLNWASQFECEFKLHFEDSSSELKFATNFMKDIMSQIEQDINNYFKKY